MKSAIFLSYSSSQSDVATRIELSLAGDGHAVFRDRSALPPGESFDARIRAAIEDSDLFIFLISPESVSEGRYTLTELKFAEQKWSHPAGHVLPVFVRGDAEGGHPGRTSARSRSSSRAATSSAEVAAEVDRLTAPWWRRMLAPRRLVPTVCSRSSSSAAPRWDCPPISSAARRTPGRRCWSQQSQSEVDVREPCQRLGTPGASPRRRARIRSECSRRRSELAMKRLRSAGIDNRGERERFEALVKRDGAGAVARRGRRDGRAPGKPPRPHGVGRLSARAQPVSAGSTPPCTIAARSRSIPPMSTRTACGASRS